MAGRRAIQILAASLLCVTTLVFAAQSEQAVREADLAAEAAADSDAATALEHLLKAHELAPNNRDYIDAAAMMAAQLERVDDAVRLFQSAQRIALQNDAHDDIAFYNREIFNLRAVFPPWVGEKLNAASEIPAGREGAVDLWTEKQVLLDTHLKKGDDAAALAAAKQMVSIARDGLGNTHFITISSLRALAQLFQFAGHQMQAELTLKSALVAASGSLGDAHPETLSLQEELAQVYLTRSAFGEALKLYKSIREGYANGLGSKHPAALTLERDLAVVYQNQARFKDATSALESACASLKDVLGTYHEQYVDCVLQHANFVDQRGDYKDSLPLYERALAIQSRALGAGHPALFEARMLRASVLRKLSQLPLARDQLLKLVDDAQRAPEPVEPALSDAKSALAHVHTDSSNYPQAERLVREVFEFRSKSLGPDHRRTLTSLAQLAEVYHKQGHLSRAEVAFQDAHKRFQRTLGDEHPATITLKNNVGQILEKQGLFDKAEPYLRDAFKLSSKVLGEHHPTTRASINNLALLHESQGVFDKAESLYQNSRTLAVKILGPEHPGTLAIVNNLAFLYMLQQNFDRAGPLFKTVADSWSNSLGERHQTTLKGLNNLARAYHKTDKLSDAEKLFEKTLRLRRETLGPGHIDTLRSMHDLGALYITQSRFAKANALLAETLALDEKILGAKHPYTFETLNAIARLKELENKTDESLKLRKVGFGRRSEFLNQMLWVTGDNAREGYVRLHKPELDEYLRLLTKVQPQTAGKAALEVSLKRKGLLLKIASETQQIVRLSGQPELSSIANELTSSRKQLAALTLSGPTVKTGENHLNLLHQLEEKIDELTGQLGRVSAKFQRSSAKYGLDELIGYLPADAVLVDFVIFNHDGQAKLMAGVVAKSGGDAEFALIVYENFAEIQSAVIEHRSVIQDEDSEEDDFVEAGQSAYDLIWRPLKEAIGASTEIYLVPDGVLNILPFNALVDEDGDYLVRNTNLHLLSSSRDLFPNRLPLADGQIVIAAGPDYNTDQVQKEQVAMAKRGRRSASVDVTSRAAAIQNGLRALSVGLRGLKFSPLPGAEEEGRIITAEAAKSGKNNRIFLKGDAQEIVLKELSQPPEILHLATHGFFLEAVEGLRKRLLSLQRGSRLKIPPPGDNPLLRAGLAFAGINSNAEVLGEIDTDNDGILTALEVLSLNLTGTRLAVLSACETGIGEIHEGEGVYGLRRAFQEAGAASVISSLWEVSDAGTQALMASVYKKVVEEDKSPQRALRETQVEMLDSEKWYSPYIWSAFTIVGM
jgi:CHAT domain-containing protein